MQPIVLNSVHQTKTIPFLTFSLAYSWMLNHDVVVSLFLWFDLLGKSRDFVPLNITNF
jgi:hypothetical protein